MVNERRKSDLEGRIIANYIARNMLKSNFKRGSPLSYGNKELRYCLPAIARRLNKLKREYKKLTGVRYYISSSSRYGN